jgi:hypothetical protein
MCKFSSLKSVLRNGVDEWSWDRQRLARIPYKKTLADAAIDGVVPQAKLASPEEARRALAAWIERPRKGGSQTGSSRVPDGWMPEEIA